MLNANPYAMIQSQYEGFPKVMKKIADYILNDPVRITSISIQQMAADLSIAESSIIRFCKLIGSSGFAEMKLQLAKYAPYSVRTIFEDLSENDTVESITQNVFARNIDTLQRAASLLNFEEIKKATEVLQKSKCIIILGVGASGTIADDFYIRLMRIGINAKSFTDSHLMQIAAGQCDETTTIVGISHTGKTREIVKAMDTARAAGASTIGITGYPNTPLKEVSDICLELYSPEQLFVSPRVAQFSLIDSLYVNLAIHQQDQVVDKIKQMNRVLSDFRM